jgi:hypothetical protein
MSEKHVVTLVIDREAPDPPDHALRDLAAALGDGGGVGPPDDEGVVEVTVEAEDFEAAVKRVFDAIAAAGADDHLEIAEHPDIPGHWRQRQGS